MTERGPTGPPTRTQTPWTLRIGFRLGVTGVVLMLVAYVVLPTIHDLSLRIFGFPGLERQLTSIDPAAATFAGLERLTERLLAEAEQQGPGQWIPTADAAATLDRHLAEFGAAYVWLDGDRRVVCATAALGLAVGEQQAEIPELLQGGGATRPSTDNALDRIVTGAWKQGEFAGWLLVYPWVPAPGLDHAEDALPLFSADGRRGEALILSEDEVERTNRASNFVINLVSFLLFAVLAVVVSSVVSRMVTRRVTRLARLAVTPVDDPRSLPGPFDETGNDEIATLARSMNTMRGRVLELVADLERRDQERRRWIAQVSHDFRTPLTALIACLERAESQLDEARTEDVRERLSIARLDAERLVVLTEDLLDIARLETDESLVREPVPPGELVRHAARGLGDLAEQKHVALDVEVAPGLPTVTADGRRLMRGLENLLRNALHHAAERVLARTSTDGTFVRFEVVDDGPGLPHEDGVVDIDSLGVRRSRDDSAGLGLVVVRKVAEAHGGRMGASNVEGGGASVWFEVPASPA